MLAKDFPFREKSASYFLVWILGLMSYLLTLACFVVFHIEYMAYDWQKNVLNKLSLQIPPALWEQDDKKAEDFIQELTQQLKKQQAVKNVKTLSQSHLLNLIEPWIGAQMLQDWSLPILIDVEVHPPLSQNKRLIKSHISKQYPIVHIEDHGEWRSAILEAISGLKITAWGLLIFVLLACAGTVMFTTYTKILVNRKIIDLFSLMGASENYLAHQIQKATLIQTLKGSGIGVGLSLITLVAWVVGARASNLPLLKDLTISLSSLAFLVAVPALLCLIAAFTSEVTSLKTFRYLNRMRFQDS